jgi:hypothetical protein
VQDDTQQEIADEEDDAPEESQTIDS